MPAVFEMPTSHRRNMTTKDKIRVIAQLYNQGKTQQQIAKAMGYKSAASVSRYLKCIGGESNDKS